MSDERYTDPELHAYVDGELDPDREKSIEMRLQHDQALAGEVDAIRLLKTQLAEQYHGELQAPIPAAMLDAVRTETATQAANQRPLYLWASAACLALGLFVGFLTAQSGLFRPPGPATNDWVQQVVSYHEMYTLDTLRHVQSSDEARDRSIEQLQATVGQSLPIPDLQNQSIEFKHGQLLQSGGLPVVQLAYLDTESQLPVAICFRPAETVAAQPVSGDIALGEAFGLQFAHWYHDSFEVVIVGPYPSSELRVLAARVRQQLGSASAV